MSSKNFNMGKKNYITQYMVVSVVFVVLRTKNIQESIYSFIMWKCTNSLMIGMTFLREDLCDIYSFIMWKCTNRLHDSNISKRPTAEVYMVNNIFINRIYTFLQDRMFLGKILQYFILDFKSDDSWRRFIRILLNRSSDKYDKYVNLSKKSINSIVKTLKITLDYLRYD